MPTISRRTFLAGAGGIAAAVATPQRGSEVGAASMARTPADAADLRAAFGLDPAIAYLNNGSLGPTPLVVQEAVHDAQRRLEGDPVGMQWGDVAEEAEAARGRAAAFLGCDVEELAVTRNTTEAMAAVSEGAHFEAGARVLTSDEEHPGGVAGWEHEAQHRGLVLERVPMLAPGLSDDQIVAALARRIGPRTRAISVSHVTYATGRALPLPAIADLAAAKNLLFVVDGAQAVGAMPVDVSALGCHAYATSAHKWLLAPKGTGLLYVRRDARARIQPLLLRDGAGVYTAATGTRNLPAIVGLGAAVAWIERMGMDDIRGRVALLQGQLRDWIRQFGRRLGVEAITPAKASAGLTTLALPASHEGATVVDRLRREHGVVVRAVATAGREAIRVSLHLYNVAADVTRLTQGLERILSGAR